MGDQIEYFRAARDHYRSEHANNKAINLALIQQSGLKFRVTNNGECLVFREPGKPKVDFLIIDEQREISSLVIDYNQQAHRFQHIVGSNGVTKIEGYNEFAGPEYVLWFAIYVGEEIIWRVNGKYVVEVGYGK